MEQRGKWTEQQMDRWAYLILGVSLTRKKQKSTVTGAGFQSRIFQVQVYEMQEAPSGTSLAVQWLRLCLPMQEVWA